MEVVLIANPVSGARRLELNGLFRALQSAGFRIEFRPTRGPDDAYTFARAASRKSRAVIAAGGDGTIRDVARGLAHSGVPLIAWPAGTENLVAKTFGYRACSGTVYETLTAGRTLRVDLAQAPDQAFLVVGGVGFDAEVVRRLTHVRNGHITHLTYADPLWRTFWQHRFPRVRVTGDDLAWCGRGMVFIGNISRYSLGLPVVRDAVWDDGRLDVVIFSCRHQIELIGHSVRTLMRRHIEHPSVIYRRVQRVRIEADEDHDVPVQFDGDNAGFLPLEVEVAPKAVTLLVPPDCRQG